MIFAGPCKEKCDELPRGFCRAAYVHVPFCARKCPYCDFYSVPFGPDAAGAYVRAAPAELAVHRHELAAPLASVFLGGGTPTVLGPELLAELLGHLRPWIGPHTEVTIEANPGTVDAATADALVAGGVNRVSLGVQSFQDEDLCRLGRIHTAAEAREAVSLLRRAGIGNLGLDLMYGVPGQTTASWGASLAEALGLRPEHLSCYALSFEPGTRLAADLRAGRVEEMDAAVQEACYRQAIDACREAGMEHYEISNFAAAGRRCRHNLTYWRNEPYLGIGPAAASYLGGVRRMNLPDLGAYLVAVSGGHRPPATREKLTGRSAMAETVMLALRLREGLCRADFRQRYGRDVGEVFPRSILRHKELGTLEATAGHLRIAEEALFVSDTILADILAEA